MALYRVLKTPGREVMAPLEGEKAITNQDAAKVLLQRFRAEARKAGEKDVDFVVVRIKDHEPASGGNTATSVRLGEVTRKKLTKLSGRVMAITGEPCPLGDAIELLLDIAADVDDDDLEEAVGVKASA